VLRGVYLVAHNAYGNRCFAGPSLWNSLPQQLRQPDTSFTGFKTLLKTFFVSVTGLQRYMTSR